MSRAEVCCEGGDWSFSRTLCACGWMHDYCTECGRPARCELEVDA